MKTSDRKKDHVSLTVSGNVHYIRNTGFEHFQLRHEALPELNYNEIDTRAVLLNRTFDFPLFISSMTGGYHEGGSVNAIIAEFCEQNNLPFGVGSQRVALEQPETRKSFEVVRQRAPKAFICSNIGGCQLIENLDRENMEIMLDMIQADAAIIHLNPLQELMQPEGDRNFKGILDGIASFVEQAPVPVIVKETGAGISGKVARKLLEMDVDAIDVAGAGGTSWSKVENARKAPASKTDEMFNEWGISTVQCIQEVDALRGSFNFEIIASGGVRNGFDIVKSLCLGANFTAMAQPVVKAIISDGLAGMNDLYKELKKQVKLIMCLTGTKKVENFSREMLLYRE